MKWIDLASVNVRFGRFVARGSGYMATKITTPIFVKNNNQMSLRFHWIIVNSRFYTALQLVCTLHIIEDDFVKTAGWTTESTKMHTTAVWTFSQVTNLMHTFFIP